jgi:hypothetical protein
MEKITKVVGGDLVELANGILQRFFWCLRWKVNGLNFLLGRLLRRRQGQLDYDVVGIEISFSALALGIDWVRTEAVKQVPAIRGSAVDRNVARLNCGSAILRSATERSNHLKNRESL